jgi:peptide/nickel transport system permease protein
MQQYIARRLLLNIPVLFLVSLIIFCLVRLLPGDAIMAMVAEASNIDPATLDAMRAELGLDLPLYHAYGVWLLRLIQGDIGTAFSAGGRPITDLWARALPISIELTILSMVVALAVALPLGVLSAIRQDTTMDYVARIFAISGLSIPSFWSGTLIIVWAAIWFKWIAPVGYVSPFEDLGKNLQQFLVPAIIEGYILSATTARLARSTMLEVLREDYIRTAWAKGLRERAVVMRHALRNALIPVVTIVGNQFRILIGGLVVIEVLFNLPGMGRLTYDAILQRDYGVIQANVMFIAFMVVSINLVVDIAYAWLDPRIRYS